jgi:hypothetical protein
VFVEHEPVISHEHRNEMRRWNRVPYPYRLGKMDGAWLFVLFLIAGGFAFSPPAVAAGFIIHAGSRVVFFQVADDDYILHGVSERPVWRQEAAMVIHQRYLRERQRDFTPEGCGRQHALREPRPI